MTIYEKESFCMLASYISGIKKEGFREAVRGLINANADEDDVSELLDFFKNQIHVFPDAWRVVYPKDLPTFAPSGSGIIPADSESILEVFEIENTLRVSERKIEAYADLFWLLDAAYTGLRLFGVTRHGTLDFEYDLWLREER